MRTDRILVLMKMSHLEALQRIGLGGSDGAHHGDALLRDGGAPRLLEYFPHRVGEGNRS